MAEPKPVDELTVEEARSQLKEVIADRDSLKKSMKGIQTEFDTIRTQHAQLLEQQKKAGDEEAQRKEALERQKLEEQGKYKESLAQLESQYKQKLELQTKGSADQIERFKKTLMPRVIRSALSGIPNLVPEAVDLLVGNTDIRARIQLDENYEPVVLGDDGKPMLDEKMNKVTPEAFIQAQLAGKTFLFTDKMPVNRGTPKGKIGGQEELTYEAALADPKLRDKWMAEDPDGYNEAMRAYYSPAAVTARSKAKFAKK